MWQINLLLVLVINLLLILGPYLYADVLDLKHLNSVVVNYGIDWVIHFSALLSAVGELNPRKALEVSIIILLLYYFLFSYYF